MRLRLAVRQHRADEAVLPGDPGPASHPHPCAAAGSFSEQFARLFRDYLRGQPRRAEEYARLKHELSPLLRTNRRSYGDGKVPFIWATMQMADEWAQSVGWEPVASDA